MSNPQPPVKPNVIAEAGQPDKVNGTQSVVIGCKLPNGLIAEVGRQGDDNHQVVRINGANSDAIVSGTGYGLTRVSKSFWDLWLNGDKDQNLPAHKNLEFVRKGLVFVHADEASAASYAKERAGVKSGFEAIDPSVTIMGPDGKTPLLETDMSHFNDGKMAVAQARQAARR